MLLSTSWIIGLGLREHTRGWRDHMWLKAGDYLGSRCAGLVIATQKLISRGKERRKRKESRVRGGVCH